VGSRWRLGRCHSLQVSGGHLSAQKSAYWEANEARHHDLIREGKSDAECAALLGCSLAAARQKRQSYGLEAPSPVLRPVAQRPRISTVLDLEPAPYAVPIPRPATSNHGHSTKCWTAVVFTDTHVPYHDQAALNVVYGIIRDVKPRVIVHLGDLLDCTKISRYTKDRNEILNTQDEIDGARTILHQVSQLAPDAEKWWLEGNHEVRLEELLNTLPGTAAEIAKLRDIKSTLTWKSLLRLDEIGWSFVPTKGQALRPILPKLVTKHGNVVRKWSGMSAKGEWERYGKSGLSGHVHRVGQFYTTDYNGSHVWTECGCTCLLKPGYLEDPNWSHACVLVHFTPNGERFSVEPVYIQDGRALWRSTEYRAA
jgi:hypothetical protein